MKETRLATEGTRLGMVRASRVAEQLLAAAPAWGNRFIVPIAGEPGRRAALQIRLSVLRGESDVGVHAGEHLPPQEDERLVLAAVLKRGEPRDALCGTRGAVLAHLSSRSTIATDSVLRSHQLLQLRPDLTVSVLNEEPQNWLNMGFALSTAE